MASKETHGSGAPIQPAAKGTKVEPQVNSEMELGSLGNGHAEEANLEADIMQAARTGDIAAMERLFESKEYDATYSDDEGITALHVRPSRATRCQTWDKDTTADLRAHTL